MSKPTYLPSGRQYKVANKFEQNQQNKKQNTCIQDKNLLIIRNGEKIMSDKR